jgi:hypothetical protein
MKTSASSRRGFLWRAGALLSAPLGVAATAASAHPASDHGARPGRAAQLEDMNAIRELTRRYLQHVNAGAHDDAARLFAAAAHARTDRIRALAADPLVGADAIEIGTTADDASVRIPCTAETATPIEPATPLVAMARAQGGGVVWRSERGVLEGAYVKRGGAWKIERLVFRAT